MGQYDTDDFQHDAIERSREVPVLVDFWAEWCGPCRTLGPVLERLAETADGRWELVKLDTESHPEIAGRYGIRSIPAVKLFVDGEVVDEFVGALPEPSIREWLARAIPGPSGAVIRAAREQLRAGSAAAAAEALTPIVEAEPDNEEARVLLAEALLFDEPQRALELAGDVSIGSSQGELASSVRDLAGMMIAAADPESLAEGPARPNYVEGLRALRARDLHAALDRFIEVIGIDRGYDDDGARRACLAIFRYLGEDHDETREHRMAFSNAVMS